MRSSIGLILLASALAGVGAFSNISLWGMIAVLVALVVLLGVFEFMSRLLAYLFVPERQI